jgi:hypothetical protein
MLVKNEIRLFTYEVPVKYNFDICDWIKKGKDIPETGRGGPRGFGTSRLLHFLDNRREIYKSYAPAALYPPGKLLVIISVRG